MFRIGRDGQSCGLWGSSDSASVDTVPATGVSVTVDVLDNSYRPLVLEIAAGTEVVFDNQGRNDHNLLPDSVSGDAQLREMLATDSSAAAWGWSPPILSQRRFIPMSFRPPACLPTIAQSMECQGRECLERLQFLE